MDKWLTKYRNSLGILLVLGIIYLALVPRILTVLKGNYIFGFDQGRDYLVAKSIVVDHKQRLIGSELGGGFAGLGGVYQGPGYYYLLTIPFVLFHGDPYGGVVLMLLFSLAAIGFSYYLGREVLGKWGGLLVALLFTVSPTFIQQTKYIWNTHPSTIFILIALWMVHRFIGTERLMWLAGAAFMSGFVYNFQTAVAIPLCIGLLVWLVVYREKRISAYVVTCSSFIIAFSPLLLFWIKHKSLNVGSIASGALHKDSKGILFYLLDHLNTFWYGFLDTFPRPHMWLLIIFAVVVLVALWHFLTNEENTVTKKFYQYLLLLIPVSFLVFGFLRNSIYVYYLMELNVVYILAVVYVLVKSWHEPAFLLGKVVWVVFGILVVYGSIDGTLYFVREMRSRESMDSIAHKIKAVDLVYERAHGKPFGLLIFTPPVYTYDFDYILWWHGQRKYHYLPTNTKEDQYFIIVEPDAAQPWTYKGWVETVVKPAHPVHFEKLPGDLLLGSEGV